MIHKEPLAILIMIINRRLFIKEMANKLNRMVKIPKNRSFSILENTSKESNLKIIQQLFMIMMTRSKLQKRFYRI